ncbi:MAG: hypothetical protein JXQ65_08815 [Candidatus Marinimicrobia bacterium]|nr:hypothetical protein [Candidatus Neomarinimicrobiota bacterium]
MIVTLSIIIFTFLSGIVMLFQACLVAGLPWGAASMGGKFPGRYPPKMRVVAIANILVLLLITGIVLSRAGLVAPSMMPFSKIAVWFVVAFFGLGTVMNAITPSKIERIWAPVAGIQLITSIIIALN